MPHLNAEKWEAAMEKIYSFTVDDAMEDRFREGTTPRSGAYRRAFERQLRRAIEKKQDAPLPYKIGTAEADAYFAGIDHANEYLAYRDARQPLYE